MLIQQCYGQIVFTKYVSYAVCLQKIRSCHKNKGERLSEPPLDMSLLYLAPSWNPVLHIIISHVNKNPVATGQNSKPEIFIEMCLRRQRRS